jgi:superfamily II DNA or RNA helicase
MSLVNAGTFEGLIRSLDSDPLRRGKQFEKITKWWLQNDPIHSRDVKKVWLWDEWPDRPGRDIGVDLVAEMRDGSLCAIQSKCFDMGRDIPKSELDSFVSAASTRTFKHRWLVASTDGLSANARRMLRDNHVTQILFSYLDSLEGFWPASFDALGGTPTIVKASPRPHQQDAIRDVIEGLSKVSRGQLIMACGTGKTLTALWITEALEPSTILVLVPSLSLLSQTLSEWAKNANTKWDYLCVCSDETVNKSDDAPISTTDDLPFDVTTKPADIAAFLERRGRKIIFSTYQSSAQVAKAQKTAGKKFDLVICDEAHRLTGKNDAEFATALDDSKIPAKKRLFMTATPRTYTVSVKAKASERGVEITSMDDESIFGKELHKLSFGQAIEKELLTDYRVVIVGVTDPQVQELIDQRELVSVAGTVETDARTLAAHIGLAKATKDYDLKRIISFHGRIKTAQAFAHQHAAIVDWMPEDHKPSGTIWADTINGAMNSSDRRKLLNKLKAEIPGQHALLSNARCLTEGVDVPSLDGVAFIDPRSSQVDIIQAVGRAIRKAKSKSLGTIVLPVLIPNDADADHALQDSAFKPIWAIINALRSHDDDLANQLNELRTQMGSIGTVGLLPKKITIDLPVDIDRLIPDFSGKFTVSAVEQTTSSWEYCYGLLVAYTLNHPGELIQKVSSKVSSHLRNWIGTQRGDYTAGRLRQDRISRLEKVPGWVWDPREEMWEESFAKLIDFVNSNGHARVPRSFVTADGFKLGQWTQVQRRTYDKGWMDSERISKLEELPSWPWNLQEAKWFLKFEQFVTYGHKNGSFREVPDIKIGDFNPAKWASRQRLYRSDLSPRQIEALSKLTDWSWSPRDDRFDYFFELLLKWSNEMGHSEVPFKTKIGNVGLGGFVSKSRSSYAAGRLNPTQIELFESLPGWTWDPRMSSWNQNYAALKHIFENKGSGTSRIPKHLKGWISLQRADYANKSISEERILLLQSLPGWIWNAKDELEGDAHWDKYLSELHRFQEANGHCYVRSKFLTEEGLALGTWVSFRRAQYKKQLLPSNRIKQLEDIPGWVWVADKHAKESAGIQNKTDVRWDEMFTLLKEFVNIHGHAIVPKSHVFRNQSLGVWVRRQRYNRTSGLLTESKQQKLETLNGWVWAGDPVLLKSTKLQNNNTDEKWFQNYHLLVKAILELGIVKVSSNLEFEGKRLGKWIYRQRQNWKSKSLSVEQIQSLESLDGWKWQGINTTLTRTSPTELSHTKVVPNTDLTQ